MSEARRAILTHRRKGASEKEVRVKQHNEERKGKRQDLLLKRRIPKDALSDEEPEENVKNATSERQAEPSKSLTWEKSEQRRKQLLEWQAKRNASKMARAVKQKKPFVTVVKQPVLSLMPLPSAPPQPLFETSAERCDTVKDAHAARGKKVLSVVSNAPQPDDAAKRVTRSQKAPGEKSIEKAVPIRAVVDAPDKQRPVAAKQEAVAISEGKNPAKGKPAPPAPATSKREDPKSTKKKEVAEGKMVSGPYRGKGKDNGEKKAPMVEKKVAAFSKKTGGEAEKSISAAAKVVGKEKKGGVTKKASSVEKHPTSEDVNSKALDRGHAKTQLKKLTKPAKNAERANNQSCSDIIDNTIAKSQCEDSTGEVPSIPTQVKDENIPPEVAWVPGYRITPKARGPSNFDDIFGDSFSPFCFTGAKTPSGTKKPQRGCEFTFRKTLPANPEDFVADMRSELSSKMEVDSLMEAEEEEKSPAGEDCAIEGPGGTGEGAPIGVTEVIRSGGCEVQAGSDGCEVEDKKPCADDDSIKAREKDDVRERGGGAGVRGGCQVEDGSIGGGDSKEQEKEMETISGKVTGFAPFRKLHTDVVEKLTSLCQQWEQRPSTASIPEDQQEEVLGQIRTTVCQAQLLMKQKLKQYIELVGQAEHGGGEQPTKAEDLQGFWDMVYFQVEDILKKFQGLESLENNNWQVERDMEPATKKRKKCALPPPAAVAAKTGPSEKQLAAREKREAARLKMKEMRQQAASRKGKEEEEEGEEPSTAGGITPCSSGGNVAAAAEGLDKEGLDNQGSASSSCGAICGLIPKNSSTAGEGTNVLSEVEKPLMDFDTPAPSCHVKCSKTPPPLSPPPTVQDVSPLPAAMLRTPKKLADVPTAQLLSLTPAKVPSSTPSKVTDHFEGAFKKMYVAVTPSKKLRAAHPELTTDDIVMSEARRSVRLAHKQSQTPGHQVVVSSLADLPEDLDFSYCPPSQL